MLNHIVSQILQPPDDSRRYLSEFREEVWGASFDLCLSLGFLRKLSSSRPHYLLTVWLICTFQQAGLGPVAYPH